MEQATEAHFLELLREQGGRVTAPRRLIVNAFLQAGGHVTVEELAATVQATHPEIALSTIYRTMETLEELGAVEHLHLGHGPAVYHRTDERHHHLVCEDCGQVTELPEAAVQGLAAALLAEYGFHMDARHFALPGQCADCADRVS